MKHIFFLIIVCSFSCNNHDKIATIDLPKGGFDFPKTISANDSNFYFYGIKDLQKPADSLRDAFFGQKMFKAFNEPNLSVKPFAKVTFRLTSEWESMIDYVITIIQDSIIVKKRTKTSYVYKDNMSQLERSHIDILFMNYPLIKNNRNIKEFKRRYLDSLIEIYPELLNRNYYRTLLDKMYIPYDSLFSYSITKLPISESQYSELINLINSSGYWKMPYHFDCHDRAMDGSIDILEANTGNKYNVVKSYCPCGDSSKYLNMLNEIKKIAGIK
jgi:hypothetical protein